MDRKLGKLFVLIVLAFLTGMGSFMLLRPADAYSSSERRVLKQQPVLNAESISTGKFMTDFESYALDQFPLRDDVRGIKAFSEQNIFLKKDNNGIYCKDGVLSKMEYPLQEDMVNNATDHFEKIYDEYLRNRGITPYLVVVPDKNYYLAEEAGMLSMDYDRLYELVQEKTTYMQYIEIRDLLDIDDYYRTDTHWRQECIQDVAERISLEFGIETNEQEQYEQGTIETPFYGVYVGQWALPVEPDTITYLINDALNDCTVQVYDSSAPKTEKIYNLEKAVGRDPYEMFLSGAAPIVEIDNPNASTDRELVIFRDSFGSSIAPLFVPEYKKVTLIDTRYIRSELIGNYVQFEDQDVLFLYSTMMISN